MTLFHSAKTKVPKPLAMVIPMVLGMLMTFPLLHAEPVSDFSLEEQNPTSPRHGGLVSPRDYRHQVSAYYFGAAT